ncbi:putative Ig domain-containing protein [Methylocucumis oryzae]|uniref:putative Ig domain-containing protein n=1 Tax=Methylocucumis oryzae TaxID=1632867 RepID=UPI00069604E5|nr:putative Ig domain-containing protein [Methylocucumis oryzae]
MVVSTSCDLPIFTPADITAKYRNPDRANYNDGDLVIQYGNQQITIQDFFYSANYRIDKFIFSDGRVWTWETLKSLGLIGTVYADNITGYTLTNNVIKGFDGDDALQGAELNDTIEGGIGADRLYGEAGNDRVLGGAGNDYIHGGQGDDSLIGYSGNDTLNGGDGNDTYVISKKSGKDIIVNYDNNYDIAIDKVVLTNYASSDVKAITQKGSHLLFTFTDNSELEIQYYFYDDSYKIDQFVFTDTIWTDSDINGNKAPTSANQTDNIDEDHALTFATNQFGFNDSDAGDSLQAVKITQLPQGGLLTLDGVDVAVDQVISVDDINASKLMFTPDNNDYGDHYGDFYFKVSDGQAFSTDAYLFRIDVNSVNDAPYLAEPLDNQTVIYDNPLIYRIPRASFIDVDSGDTLRYSATLSDGSALPAWLNFNAKGLLFTGTPSASDVGDLTIDVIVTDKAGAQTSDQFTLSVTSANSAPTFMQAGDGIVTTTLGAYNDWGQAVSLQSDGKIVITGYSETRNGAQIALVRYNSDGSLDTEFNQTGTVLTALAGVDDRAFDLSIDDDGNLLVTGFSLTASNYDFAVLRYLANGQLDASFGEQGVVTTDFGQANTALFGDRAYSVATQTDGKIIVAGFSSNGKSENFALARYHQDGSLDTSFSGDGKLNTDLDGGAEFGQAVSLQDDGKIVVAGYDYQSANTNFQLVRYTSQGTLDTSFGNAGKVSTDFDGKTDWAQDLAIQADGKLVVAGYNFSNTSADFELARYNSDGSLDNSFSDDGKLTTDFNAGLDKAQAIALQTDGKILVAGSSFNNGQWDFAVARYNNDGSLDTSFAGTGYVISDLSTGGNDLAYDLTLQSDGKIVVTGISDGQATVVRYLSDGRLDGYFGTINTANNEISYVSHGAAVVLNSNIVIYDTELSAQGHYQGASIQVSRHGLAKAQDVFSAQGELSFSNKQALIDGVVIGTVNNSQGVLTIEFNANATEQRVNQALASIAYQNTAINPPDTVSIDWLFSDGDSNSAQTTTGTTLVNISDDNTSARIQLTGITHTENTEVFGY